MHIGNTEIERYNIIHHAVDVVLVIVMHANQIELNNHEIVISYIEEKCPTTP